MKVDVNELGPVQRKVDIELAPETVALEFSRAFNDIGRRVRVKGFRSGKIPRNVLQGIYGEEIKGQVQSRLVENSLSEAIKEHGLQIVSRPEVELQELTEGQPFVFSAVFEVKPEIAVKDYLGVEVEKVKMSVDDAQVEEALRRLQESHARLEIVEEREIVQRGDFVVLDFDGSIDGKRFAGSKGENYVLEVGGGRTLSPFDDAIAGMRVGERAAIRVPFPEDYPNREIAGQSADFSVVVREIKQKVLPPIDDDFAKDHGDSATLEELKRIIRSRLEGELQRIQEEGLKEQIIDRIIDAHSFTPPPAMVERQLRYLLERQQSQTVHHAGSDAEPAPSTEETRRSLEPRAMRQVKATLLLENISHLEKIEVSDQELQNRIDGMARAAGERGKALREIYSRTDVRDDLRAQMMFDRTAGFLLEKAKIKEVEAPVSKVDEQSENS